MAIPPGVHADPLELTRTRTSTRPNTVQICAMARSILLILALPYTLRFSLFEQYWALCLSSSGRDDPTGQWNRHSRGQAQGLLIHPTPPLVPTGRLTSLAAFGRQNSLGAREVGWMLGKKDTGYLYKALMVARVALHYLLRPAK